MNLLQKLSSMTSSALNLMASGKREFNIPLFTKMVSRRTKQLGSAGSEIVATPKANILPIAASPKWTMHSKLFNPLKFKTVVRSPSLVTQ
jgi:hypothetical protein